MARNNFNFQATLKLNSREFQRGVGQIQNSLNGLKNSFMSFAGALGAGLGLTQIVGNIKTTATELSVAMNTLKNVSNVTKDTGIRGVTVELSNYGEMLEYVRGVSHKYSQDLVAVTENFAQFHAACNKTNLSLEDQKLVFEALTRAAAAYHMSSSRAKDMMNAVTQMMSKGRVAAEELRRQLGNSLPGAFNLMAAAMGVSTQELDKLMRDGKVISSEVLPQFAAMLNQVTKSADFDSLQLSINKLKNTWYDFVIAIKAEEIFKGVIDSSTNALSWISQNIKSLKYTIEGLIAGILSYKIFSKISKSSSELKAKLIADFDAIEKKAISAGDAINKAMRQNSQTGPQQKTYTTYKTSGQYEYAGVNSSAFGLGETEALDKARKAAKSYNEQLLKLNQTQIMLSGKGFLSDADVVRINKMNKFLAATTTRGQNVAKMGSAIGRSFRLAIAGIKSALMSLGIAALISMVIGLVTSLISKMKDIKEETERINNVFSDFENGAKKVDENVASSAALLRSQYAIVSDTTKSEAIRLNTLKEINKSLGLTGNKQLTLKDLTSKTKVELDGVVKTYDKIQAAVEKWIEATKLQAKIQYQANQNAAASAKIQELETKITTNKAAVKRLKHGAGYDKNGNTVYEWNSLRDKAKGTNLEREIKNAESEIAENRKIIAATEESLNKLGVTLSSLYEPNNNSGNNNEDNSKGKTPKDVVDKYNKSLSELQNQQNNGAISIDKFDEEVAKLTQDTYEALAAFDTWDKMLKQLGKGDQQTANNVKAQAPILLENEELKKQFKEFEKQAEKDIKEQINKFEKAFEEYIQASFDLDDLKLKANTKERDTRFDYQYSNKKKRNEVLSELDLVKVKGKLELKLDEIQGLENFKNQLEEGLSSGKFGEFADSIKAMIDEVIGKIQEAKKEATSMEHIVNLSDIQSQLKDLKKEFNMTAWDSFKGVAEGAERIANSIKNIKDVMNDVDSTPFEKTLAVINLLIQSIDMAISITKTFTLLTELAAKIKEKSAMKQLAMNAAVTASENTKTSAEATAAVAGAASSQAGIPIIGPILAAAAVASIIALLVSAFAGFAKGGIIGGSSPQGDKTLARVNSGEMVLNKGQQATLFNAISSGNLGGGNGGEWRVRGTDLIKVINNTHAKLKG